MRPTVCRGTGAGRQRADGNVRALVEAARGKSLAELEKARPGVGTSLGAFAAAAGMESNVAGVATKVNELADRVGENRRQQRIREIMADAIDPLFLLQSLLAKDVAKSPRKRRPACGRGAIRPAQGLHSRTPGRQHVQSTAIRSRSAWGITRQAVPPLFSTPFEPA